MGRETRRIGSGGRGGTDVSSNGCRWRQDETNHGIHVTYSTLGGTIFTMTSMGVGKRFCKIYCLFLGGADYLASGKASLKCRRMCISEPHCPFMSVISVESLLAEHQLLDSMKRNI